MLLAIARLAAQQPLAFEVASVKRSAPNADVQTIRNQPGQFGAVNLSLRTIINQAYGIPSNRILGGPDWLDSDRWDISARMPAGMSAPEQRREMLQTLLADRFKLKARRETRESPIYHLVVARADGKLGPSLRPGAIDCVAYRAERAAAAKAAGPTAAPAIVRSSNEVPKCGTRLDAAPSGVGDAFSAQGMTLDAFARVIQSFVDRAIVDRTGLKGEYDVDLTFVSARRGAADVAAPSNDAPTIFTALQEQLGLKLEAAKGPLEVLVIDSIERATED